MEKREVKMTSGFTLYMLSIMKGERKGPAASAVAAVLLVLSWIYGAAVKMIGLMYKLGVRRVHRMTVPVISVGNITLGGTGKTPFTVYLSDIFRDFGKKPAILLRGYGNDEHRMLADELPDIPVFTGQDRVKSAMKAVREGRDLLILDDGFQHRRIARDLDIVLVDSASLFGNGRLFPRGVLREGLGALKRADIIVLTKIDHAAPGSEEELIERMKLLAGGKPVVTARHKAVLIKDVTGAASFVESLAGKKVCVASGIGDPAYFDFMVRALGAGIVARLDYHDHHLFTQKDIDDITAACDRENAEALVITGKDYVKWRGLDFSRIDEKVAILHIGIEITNGKEQLFAGLDSVISGQRA